MYQQMLKLEHLSVRVGDSLRRCEEIVKKKKSRIVPLNVIIVKLMDVDLSDQWSRRETVIEVITTSPNPSDNGRPDLGNKESRLLSLAMILSDQWQTLPE